MWKFRNFSFSLLVFVALIALALMASVTHGAECLEMCNARRALLGLFPLQYDIALSELAEREAQAQASKRRMGHVNGCPSPARNAGVGYTSRSDYQGRYFNSCYCITRSHRYAGAAVVVGRDGRTYYALMVR